MKKAFGWIAGLVGIAALGRWLARRTPHPAPAEPAAEEDPAEELRRRLDATRTEEEPAATSPPDERTIEERRADVHLKAQEAIDAMRESGL